MTSPEYSTGRHESAPEVPPVPDPELDAIRAERLAAMESLNTSESHRMKLGEMSTGIPHREATIERAVSDVHALFQEASQQSSYDMGDVVRVQRNARDGNEAYMQDGWRVTGKLANGDLRVQMTDDQGMKLTKMVTPDMLDVWRVPEESVEKTPVSVTPEAGVANDTIEHVESLIARHESKGDIPRSSEARALASSMEQQGIAARYEQFPSDSTEALAYEGIFVMQHERQAGDDEPRVRLYRGVNQIDMGIFHQRSYAEKGLYSDWGGQRVSTQTEKEAAVEEVQLFQQNPTYDELVSYEATLSRVGGDQVARRMKDRMRDIEDYVLETGESVQKALTWEHVKSASGIDAGIDISPYMSVGETAEVGGSYARRGMIVYDVPISMIAGRGEEGELLISGRLTEEHVAAFAISKAGSSESSDIRKMASRAVGEYVPSDDRTIDVITSASTIDATLADTNDRYAAQDVQAVNNKRSRELLQMVGGAKTAKELGIALDSDLNYRRTQEVLYDYFSVKLGLDATKGFTYQGEFQQERISRESITDEGVRAMRREYERDLDNEAIRQQKRERRQAQRERAASVDSVPEQREDEEVDPQYMVGSAIRQGLRKVSEWQAYAGEHSAMASHPILESIPVLMNELTRQNPDNVNFIEAQKILSHMKPNMESRQVQRILKDVDQLITGGGT